jgi:hypothetical protein
MVSFIITLVIILAIFVALLGAHDRRLPAARTEPRRGGSDQRVPWVDADRLGGGAGDGVPFRPAGRLTLRRGKFPS